jgi:hypothetical protein
MITFELVDQFTYTLKDQYENIVSDGDAVNVEKGIARFLGKVIFIPYILLFAIGLNLVFAGRNIGHWLLMILALGVLVGVWKVVIRLIGQSHKPAAKQSKEPGTQSHAVPRRSELIP